MKAILTTVVSLIILSACAKAPEPVGPILVTGATGRQGGAVASELIERGFTVRGLTRNTQSERARAIAAQGVQLVAGNFDDPESLDAAMSGAAGVFIVTNFWEHGFEEEIKHGRNVIDAAKRSGVKHIVFSSVGSAHLGTGIPHFDSKFEIEKYLRASDVPFTILRPVSFMENWALDDDEIEEGKIVVARAPEKKHQYVSVRDIGWFAAEAFQDRKAWAGVALDLAGDELSVAEFAKLVSETVDREIRLELISWEEYESQFGQESALMSKWFDEVGYSADISKLKRQHPDMLTLKQYFSELAEQQ